MKGMAGRLRHWVGLAFGAAAAGLLVLPLAAQTVAPPAAPAAPPPLSLYGGLPGFETAAISPSGDRIAIVGRVGQNDRRLVVLDKDNKPLLAVPLGDVKVRGIYWAGDNRVLVHKTVTMDLGGNFTKQRAELATMIVVPLDGGQSYQVFQNNSSVTGGIRGFYGINQRDGRYYGYFGGMTLERSNLGFDPVLNSADPVLYEVDLETGRAVKISDRSAEQQNWRTWLVGVDGRAAATLDYMAANGHWIIRNANGARIAEGVSLLGNVELTGFGAEEGVLLYSVEDEARGDDRLIQLPLAGGESKEILPDIAIRRGFYDKRTHRLLGYEVEGDTPTYTFLDPAHQRNANALLRAFPGRSVHIVDWTDAFDKWIVMVEGPGEPQGWYLVDLKAHRADPLGGAYPMAATQVGPMKMISYKASDGTAIAAVLTLPPGREARNLPVVILPHGGPMARDYPGFDWWAQALASRGYAVLQPNFRGSTGYGAAFERAGHGEWGRLMQTDISDGLAYLAKEGIVDPARACIMGASYGGYAALAGVTLQHGLYRCAVAVAGVSDVQRLTSTNIAESGYNPLIKRSLQNDRGTGSDLRAVSPVNFAAQADAPILLIHGKDDTVVPYYQSTAMAAALRRAGKPVELVTLAGEDHWLSRGETRLAMLEAAVRFVEQHNPAGPQA